MFLRKTDYQTGCLYRFVMMVAVLGLVNTQASQAWLPWTVIFFITLFQVTLDLNRQLHGFMTNFKREVSK